MKIEAEVSIQEFWLVCDLLSAAESRGLFKKTDSFSFEITESGKARYKGVGDLIADRALLLGKS